jgi:hypothetical protein
VGALPGKFSAATFDSKTKTTEKRWSILKTLTVCYVSVRFRSKEKNEVNNKKNYQFANQRSRSTTKHNSNTAQQTRPDQTNQDQANQARHQAYNAAILIFLSY